MFLQDSFCVLLLQSGRIIAKQTVVFHAPILQIKSERFKRRHRKHSIGSSCWWRPVSGLVIARKTFIKKLLNCSRSSPQLARNLRSDCFLPSTLPFLLLMIVLGLNAYHGDSAACLFGDGKLIAAAEEERFRRIKHWAGLPTQAIDYCLREGELTINEIDHVAVNRKPGVNNLRRLLFVLRHRPDPRLMWQKIKNIRSAASIKEALQANYGIEIK